MDDQGINGTNVILNMVFLCQLCVVFRDVSGNCKMFISKITPIFFIAFDETKIAFGIRFGIIQRNTLKPFLPLVDTSK